MTEQFLSSLSSDNGIIRMDAAHQGRIFVELNGTLLHTYDPKLIGNFDPVSFNNLGGNSLWPAPEGGPLAFNYLDSNWLVQPGVNTAPSYMTGDITCERTVNLKNRKGTSMQVTFRRKLLPLATEKLARKYALSSVAYQEEDDLILSQPISPEDGIIEAWSLEQFPSPEGVIAFGLVNGDPDKAVNRGFYGNPNPRLQFSGKMFQFRLGGKERLQIGISAAQNPCLIGALAPDRNLLILRTCTPGMGTRIDIADNDQPKGIYGADDQFSIFNGANLGFFELETIAPMICNVKGEVTGSSLKAQTFAFQGAAGQLKRLLQDEYGIEL